MMKDKSQLLVFAGPNGSGKSTISTVYDTVGVYINADDIKKARGCTDLEAAQEAELLREHLLANADSFTFETVLSTDRNINLLRKAKEAGYFIKSIFVLTTDASINALRVKSRVLRGGHDVPKDKISSRYEKSLKMLPMLVTISDVCIVYDNTDIPEVIFEKREDKHLLLPNKFWSTERINKLLDRRS